MQGEQSFGAGGGDSPRGRSNSVTNTPRARSATPERAADRSPRSPGGGSASPGGQAMELHPSHRGTNYLRKPPKKKKKKRKRPKSPVMGPGGVLFIPEDGPATRMGYDGDDPYYRGNDLSPYAGAAGGAGLLAAARGRRDSGDKYWRDGQS